MELIDEQVQPALQPARKTVVGIVRSFLQHHYEEGTIDALNFQDIDAEVRKHFPESKFNPYHLAHYKHKFLVKLDYVKMYKGHR